MCNKSNILILSPHPDDEVIGCSVLIRRLSSLTNIYIAYLTNGVCNENEITKDLLCKYSTYQLYLSIRLNEKEKALRFLNCTELGQWTYSSRTLLYLMNELFFDLSKLIRHYKINVVLTPPYEGAHPDHDIVNCISSILRTKFNLICLEYQCYNRQQGINNYQKFLNSVEIFNLNVSDKEKAFKENCFMIYSSQNSMILNNFSGEKEAYRMMPIYNYSLPPVAGETYYEDWGCNITNVQVSNACDRFINQNKV